MVTPIDTSSFNVTTSGRTISLIHPLKSLSLFNEGPDTVKIKMGNSAFYPIRSQSGLDLSSEYGIKNFYAVADSGTGTLKFIGTRQLIETNKTISNPQPIIVPYQTEINQTNETNILDNWIIKMFVIIGGIIVFAYITKKLFE